MNKLFLSFLFITAISISSLASAEKLKIEVSQPDAIKSALQELTGKLVSITTGLGEEVSGIVEAVGPDAVKLKELSGKEFYSAVVKLDAVTSVSYKAK